MVNTLLLYKPVGLSPLDSIKKFKKENPEFRDVKMGYAGRLDPMAEGLLLILVGDENKKKKEYEGLQKTYEVDILLGIETDSYDALGIIKKVVPTTIEEKLIHDVAMSYIGLFNQAYPPYSSPKINGKSLFALAANSTLQSHDIPHKERTIHSLKINNITMKEGSTIVKEAKETIAKILGDFRQDACIASWEREMEQFHNELFQLITMTVNCSSGTYMRTLAHDIGKKLGCGGIAYHIKRIKIGDWTCLPAGRKLTLDYNE